ncbi:unnamed protein product [Clavelina lepadiformis]|uniref:RRM domain-containing protein n=1 Tax=Clavelina lepadiformis TaxID=159417 RepID=A0ABP0GDB1_CLALP
MLYVRIADEHDNEAIEIPTEENLTIHLSSITAQFPGACGLKYRNLDTQTMRGVKLVDGILYPPHDGGVWKDNLYIVVYPKDNKRKMEDEDSQSIRSKRPAQKCSDLIVLGLPWKVEEKDLEAFFAPFGDLVMTMIKRDSTGKSKGYGFIRFSNHEAQEAVIGKRHLIEGRWCDVKIPHSKEQPKASSKIFVGRITERMTKDELRAYFEQFGAVDDVYIPTPFRAFAFVTFHDNAVAEKLIGEDQVINGVSVYINTADPKGTKDQQTNRQQSPQEGMPYQHGAGYGNRSSGFSPDQGRYFGGNNYNRESSFSGMPPQNSGSGNFGNNSGGFNMMNPAVLAAALGSWNNMLNGMFNGGGGGGGGRGSGWQNNTDMKKDGPNWNKPDGKWS